MKRIWIRRDALKKDNTKYHIPASGYGRKIKTQYKAEYQGRYYRVYIHCISNVTTEYITVNGENVIVEMED